LQVVRQSARIVVLSALMAWVSGEMNVRIVVLTVVMT